jgi:hypothetical protein
VAFRWHDCPVRTNDVEYGRAGLLARLAPVRGALPRGRDMRSGWVVVVHDPGSRVIPLRRDVRVRGSGEGSPSEAGVVLTEVPPEHHYPSSSQHPEGT